MAIYVRKENGELESYKIVGLKGEDGITPEITIGEVTTLEAGEKATVENVGTKENPVFNFGIPKGQDGTGDEKEWELLINFIAEEEVSNMNFTHTDKGTPINVKEVQIIIEALPTESNGTDGNASMTIYDDLGQNASGIGLMSFYNKTAKRIIYINIKADSIKKINKTVSTNQWFTTFSESTFIQNPISKINKITIQEFSGRVIGIGTNIKIYGR